ncbi:hypothetical protein GPECTOR_40g533 [Gonium pectorale]|uniref:Uncharacterized protein n=1 Tax=Gonium pectorale TaxID=33097 RepID=A0A150GAD4_GONPE|nr:hypothetical protein GPECTOR_40g533 [Gonium pectorale]|eukprot:KXZ46799.1 hypothetical protein GPECTOR_40g533 [Gonium pectorale]
MADLVTCSAAGRIAAPGLPQQQQQQPASAGAAAATAAVALSAPAPPYPAVVSSSAVGGGATEQDAGSAQSGRAGGSSGPYAAAPADRPAEVGGKDAKAEDGEELRALRGDEHASVAEPLLAGVEPAAGLPAAHQANGGGTGMAAALAPAAAAFTSPAAPFGGAAGGHALPQQDYGNGGGGSSGSGGCAVAAGPAALDGVGPTPCNPLSEATLEAWAEVFSKLYDAYRPPTPAGPGNTEDLAAATGSGSAADSAFGMGNIQAAYQAAMQVVNQAFLVEVFSERRTTTGSRPPPDATQFLAESLRLIAGLLSSVGVDPRAIIERSSASDAAAAAAAPGAAEASSFAAACAAADASGLLSAAVGGAQLHAMGAAAGGGAAATSGAMGAAPAGQSLPRMVLGADAQQCTDDQCTDDVYQANGGGTDMATAAAAGGRAATGGAAAAAQPCTSDYSNPFASAAAGDSAPTARLSNEMSIRNGSTGGAGLDSITTGADLAATDQVATPRRAPVTPVAAEAAVPPSPGGAPSRVPPRKKRRASQPASPEEGGSRQSLFPPPAAPPPAAPAAPADHDTDDCDVVIVEPPPREVIELLD